MTAYRSIGQVIRAVTDGRPPSASCRCREDGDADPWWRHLLSQDDNAPRVVARLPFGARGNARATAPTRSSIGRGAQQETGADRTLFVTEIGGRHQPRRAFSAC